MKLAIFESGLLIGGVGAGYGVKSLVSMGRRRRGLCVVASLALLAVVALDYQHGGLGLISLSRAGLAGLLLDLLVTGLLAIVVAPLLLVPFGVGVEIGIALRTSARAGGPATVAPSAKVGPPPTRQPGDPLPPSQPGDPLPPRQPGDPLPARQGRPPDQREELLALLRDRPASLCERAPIPRG
jgi:hypothetical protein